jgi:two-component system capsular synthesis response regulator RcsB
VKVLFIDFTLPVPGVCGAALSAKEHEVVRMLASGMTVSEIAGHFKRSVSTISKQKNMAMQRLGISTDVDLFAYARESGMVH